MVRDLLPLLLPLVVVVVAWSLNARAERKSRRRQVKEERYLALLRTFRSLYENNLEVTNREEFLAELTLCWVYAPDVVINNAYRLMEGIKTGRSVDGHSLEHLAGEFIASIRKDVLSDKETKETKLTGSDFLHLRGSEDLGFPPGAALTSLPAIATSLSRGRAGSRPELSALTSNLIS